MSVEWTADALDQLADIYVAAPTPAARETIARCIERINARLTTDPWSPGEDRGPGRRVWFSPPFVIGYNLPPGGGVVVFHIAKLKDNSPESDE